MKRAGDKGGNKLIEQIFAISKTTLSLLFLIKK